MKKTVVVIDDDSDELEIFKEAMTSVDPTLLLITFVYPDEAMRLLTQEFILQPNYIFVDINMPRLSGEACLQLLRKQKALDNSIIAIYSTSMPNDISDRLLSMGANFTFQKPYTTQEYNSILEAIIYKSGIHLGVRSKGG